MDSDTRKKNNNTYEKNFSHGPTLRPSLCIKDRVGDFVLQTEKIYVFRFFL